MIAVGDDGELERRIEGQGRACELVEGGERPVVHPSQGDLGRAARRGLSEELVVGPPGDPIAGGQAIDEIGRIILAVEFHPGHIGVVPAAIVGRVVVRPVGGRGIRDRRQRVGPGYEPARLHRRVGVVDPTRRQCTDGRGAEVLTVRQEPPPFEGLDRGDELPPQAPEAETAGAAVFSVGSAHGATRVRAPRPARSGAVTERRESVRSPLNSRSKQRSLKVAGDGRTRARPGQGTILPARSEYAIASWRWAI